MQTIATLTLNPALDVATTVHAVGPEIKLRCEAPRFHPGGGGINVSRAIHYLGGHSTAIYTAGGHTGTMLQELLTAEGIAHAPQTIADTTRESFTVYESSTKLQYRFTLPGPTVQPSEWASCLERLFDCAPDLIVTSGSLPNGVPSAIYGEITRYARSCGIRVILDTAGDALHRAMGSGLSLIKPNLRELELFAGESLSDEVQMLRAGRRLIADGLTQALVVSLGAAGAALITASDFVQYRAPFVPIASKVGAGDSMVAGIALGMAQGRELKDAVRLGVAAGSAAVMTPGTQLCRRDDTLRLYEAVQMLAAE